MRKLLILLIAVTLLLGYQSGASAWDESWDFSSPSGTDDSGQLDSFIQDTKKSFAERLNGDHFFDEDNDLMNELTAGDHRHVTMLEKQAAPAHAASTGIVYTIADGTDTELGYTDARGNDLQITVDGGLNLTGGYTIDDLTLNNSLSVGNDVIVTGEVTAGGDVAIGGDCTIAGEGWTASSKIVNENSSLILKGAVTYNGSSGTVLASYNVSSVSKGGTGTYTINWGTDFANTNYYCVGTTQRTSNDVRDVDITSQATGSVSVRCGNSGTSISDTDRLNIIAFGTQ